MRTVWSVSDCIVSPLGATSACNYESIQQGISGIALLDDAGLLNASVYAARIDDAPHTSNDLTRFELFCINAIEGALANLTLPSAKTLFILSTTKGNIELLDKGLKEDKRLYLHNTAKFLADRFHFHDVQVVSNACISGVLALLVAKRFIEAGKYDHAVVVGADTLSNFVLSGFHTLQALSKGFCKPFDISRDGINLGEAAAVMVLSAEPESMQAKASFKISGGGISNDANHISGPSRTGEELAFAISKAIESSGTHAAEIDFISAHGTATLYNDEMEAKAFSIAGLEHTPVNSFKGYYGHTLGAAGVLETILSMHSALHNELIPTKGFTSLGVSKPLNVYNGIQQKQIHTILKTASGFGGCNAALVIQKA